MKKNYQQIAIVLIWVLFFTFGFQPQKALAQYENTYVSYSDFYENLAPYGQWIEDPKYGYVWSPNVDGSFRPYYTSGHWAMTDYGNTWISDYPWGWACFHYGRWTYDNYYGWLWIPGVNWGPAWVSWRDADVSYGWAPLGPDYDLASSYGDYTCPNDWWVFIPYQYIYVGNYYRYWNGPHGNSHIIHHSHTLNNVYDNNHILYVSGPHTKEVEVATHYTVQVYHIKNSTNLNTRVHDNEIKMYRPAEIRPDGSAGGYRPSPPNVVSAPQPIKTFQPVNTGQTTPPQFRNEIPAGTAKPVTPGTNINKVAEPAKPAPRYDNNPYEWDVNKSVPQPRKNTTPVYHQEEENNYRPAPVHQAPVQQQQQQQQPPRTAPAPQPAPRPVPAPSQPQRQSPAPAPRQAPVQGGRR